jgi:hypothetical protein
MGRPLPGCHASAYDGRLLRGDGWCAAPMPPRLSGENTSPAEQTPAYSAARTLGLRRGAEAEDWTDEELKLGRLVLACVLTIIAHYDMCGINQQSGDSRIGLRLPRI